MAVQKWRCRNGGAYLRDSAGKFTKAGLFNAARFFLGGKASLSRVIASRHFTKNTNHNARADGRLGVEDGKGRVFGCFVSLVERRQTDVPPKAVL